MKWLDRLPLRWQFLMPPLFGFVLIFVLLLASSSIIRNQSSVLEKINDVSLRQFGEINTLITVLVNGHSHLLTVMMQAEIEERDAADATQHQNWLRVIQRVEEKIQRLRQREKALSSDIVASLDRVQGYFEDYKGLTIEALGLIESDSRAAIARLLAANRALEKLGRVLLDVMENEAGSFSRLDQQIKQAIFPNGEVIVYLLVLLSSMLYAGVYFSTRLSASLNSINQALISLLKGQTDITLPKVRQHYLKQLCAAVYKFRNTLRDHADQQRHLHDTVMALEKSQLRYRQMFESNQAIKLIIDSASGRIIDCNPAAERFYGYDRSALLSMTIGDINCLPEKELREEMENARKQARLYFSFRHRTATGETRDVEVYTCLIQNDDIDAFYSIIFDVTERKRAEKALQESEERFALAMSVANDGIWDWNLSAETVYFDARFYTMLGYEVGAFPAEMAQWEQRIHTDDVIMVRRQLREQLKQHRETIEIEYRLQHRQGHYLWIKSRGKVVERNPAGDIVRIVGTNTDITQRRFAEEALKASEKHYRSLIETSSSVVWEYDVTRDKFNFVSPQIERLTGYEASLWTNFAFWSELLHPEDKAAVLAFVDEKVRTGETHSYEYRLCTRQGDICWVHCDVYIVDQPDCRLLRGYSVDVTELKKAQLALQRAQKMEAVGQLTGGIAHDFNNILGVVAGNLELLEKKLPDDVKTMRHLDSIRRATQRAIDLTRKLLGFSRREEAAKRVIDINHLIRDMQSLIERSLTPQVHIDYRLDENLWPVELAAGDFEDALLNLVLNARDAMQGRGTLTVRTSRRHFERDSLPVKAAMSEGDYVELVIEDTGTGMSEEVQARIFEPFFTTKQTGEGTGLGLAMVFGFVERSSACIDIDSVVGEGTAIHLYFPRSRQVMSSREDEPETSLELPVGNEAVLLVDDEPGLLELAAETLSERGYRVTTASNARQALEALDTGKVDIVFSDVVMPGMNGYELSLEILRRHPAMKIALTSGYTGKQNIPPGFPHERIALLEKPYSRHALLALIRQTLDSDVVATAND